MNPEDEKKLKVIQEKLDNLSFVLGRFQEQVSQIKKEVADLKSGMDFSTTPEKVLEKQPEILSSQPILKEEVKTEALSELEEKIAAFENVKTSLDPKSEPLVEKKQLQKEPEQQSESIQSGKKENNLEDFIGGNLLSKLGIGMLLIGIAIFINYAVENNLISELGRILLAYTAGIVLIGFAYYLRSKYKDFSAVLMGGGLATGYFTTYLGYNFYDIPAGVLAFVLMILISAYAVFEAIRYNLQIIGFIGLLGAYAVPVLLSKSEGNINNFFAYIALINVAIIVLMFFKKWESLRITSFIISWLVFIAWNMSHYQENTQYSMIFACIYFASFFISFLLDKEEKGDMTEAKISTNSLLFFLIGNYLIHTWPGADQDFFFNNANLNTTLFTLGNMLIHALLAAWLMRSRPQSRNLIDVVQVLAITFFTLSIAIYFELKVIIILWAVEAFILCLFGLLRKNTLYKKISFVLLGINVILLLSYWRVYNQLNKDEVFAFLLNPYFFSSLAVIGLIAGMAFVQHRYADYNDPKNGSVETRNVLVMIPLILAYVLFGQEINAFFQFLYLKSESQGFYDMNQLYLKENWLKIFSAAYLCFFIFTSLNILKHEGFYNFSIVMVLILMTSYVVSGFPNLNHMSSIYLQYQLGDKESLNQFQPVSSMLYGRYWNYVSLFATLLASFWMIRKTGIRKQGLVSFFYVVTNLFILALLSFEIFQLMRQQATSLDEMYELGERAIKVLFTIAWIVYAIILIVLGIVWYRKMLRFTGFGIIALALVKLFAFDLTNLSTLNKILVFISIAVIFLLTAFLYNKYKHIILAEDKD